MDTTKILWISALFVVFILGWLSGQEFSEKEPFNFSLIGESNDVPSPQNHVEKDQIHVYKNSIVLDIEDASWAEFTDTNSMDPVIDVEANTFEIQPKSPEEVQKGDIISYESEQGLIIHRVVEIDQDEQGWYAIAKGDNLSKSDPKIRFEQIKGVVIGIIY
ncbi:MAG: hypothetical protein V3V78_05000 [Candidatus Woesearchaeota archaeon]